MSDGNGTYRVSQKYLPYFQLNPIRIGWNKSHFYWGTVGFHARLFLIIIATLVNRWRCSRNRSIPLISTGFKKCSNLLRKIGRKDVLCSYKFNVFSCGKERWEDHVTKNRFSVPVFFFNVLLIFENHCIYSLRVAQ